LNIGDLLACVSLFVKVVGDDEVFSQYRTVLKMPYGPTLEESYAK